MSTCPVVSSDTQQETAEMLHQKNVQKALEVRTYISTNPISAQHQPIIDGVPHLMDACKRCAHRPMPCPGV